MSGLRNGGDRRLDKRKTRPERRRGEQSELSEGEIRKESEEGGDEQRDKRRPALLSGPQSIGIPSVSLTHIPPVPITLVYLFSFLSLYPTLSSIIMFLNCRRHTIVFLFLICYLQPHLVLIIDLQ